MIMSGVTLAKLVGVGVSLTGAWATYRNFPDKVMVRKLNQLFRIGGLYYKFQGYKKRELRNYPSVKRVAMYLDRTEAVFTIPQGLDPAEIQKAHWLFTQTFGRCELHQNDDAKTFVMKAYRTDIAMYDYDAEQVDAAIGKLALPVYVGKERGGELVYNMVDNPHLLVAGETGAGKSVALRSILTTLIRNVPDLELYCADLKRSEFHLFKGIAKEVVVDAGALGRLLGKLRREMRKRGDQLDAAGEAHIDDLPAWDRPPYIVLAVDEVALLKRDKDVMDAIEEIGAIGRALGVYLILSMQRPDSDVLDGKLKNNLTVRLAFRHADGINSRITLGSEEAASIKQSEKGRAIAKLDGLHTIQAPHLSLEDARALLAPFKRADAQVQSEPEPEEYEFIEEVL
jgi:S-DNA-T family DNA segregation ATPase FtsK/SpoIIIE